VLRQLAIAAPVVVPTFVFQLGSPVHRALVGYKAAVTPTGRQLRQQALSEWLAAFLDTHRSCLSPGDEDVLLVPVPSSAEGRPSWYGSHPLVQLCEAAAVGVPRLRVSDALLASETPPVRLQARRRGYAVARDEQVRGRRVAVVDDIFVSGARLLSATASLALAGARVAAAVPIGRLIRPDHNAVSAAYWQQVGATPVDPTRCSACRPGQATLGCATPRVVERVAA
jgi:predicted amidophosphoribosyltransferase